MVSVCFYFQVHQPWRLRKYTVFDISNDSNYFDQPKNREIIERVAKKCYLPANKLILDLIKEQKGKFKVAYSVTGTLIEQLKKFYPPVIESFKDLAKTGKVEFLSETYYHSLSYLYSKTEFREQVNLHKKMINEMFGQDPKVFRNTELIYNNELAKDIEDMGFNGILAEGADHILDWRSPNFLYNPRGLNKIKLMLKNYRLSDDIAFRFSNQSWNEFPLTSDKFTQWINSVNGSGEVINLFMDYETIGEHQWAQTGIFRFFKALPDEILKHKDNNFMTPSEIIKNYHPKAELDIHRTISWADIERDLSAWLGNKMQDSAIKELYAIENAVKQTNDPQLISDWRKLTTSDHFYYMCTKYFADGDVHKYFNPYDSPYDCFIVFMNVMNDIIIRIKMNKNIAHTSNAISDQPSKYLEGL